jgi:tight adherence protein B
MDFFPGMFVKSKKKKRVCILNGQLADAIVLISNSLKAGYSFLQAVEMVSKEMPPPISEEFYQVQKK